MIEPHLHNGADSPKIDVRDLIGPVIHAVDAVSGVSALRTAQPAVIQRGFYTLGAGTDIAFDAATLYRAGSLTSHTWTHTTAGTNRNIYVATVNPPSAVSYAGVQLTRLAGGPNNIATIWGISAAANGANTVQASFAIATGLSAVSLSYTGANQLSVKDQTTNKSQTGGTVLTGGIGTGADRGWAIMSVRNNTGPATFTAGTDDVIRGQTGGTSGDEVFAATDTNTMITPAGAATQTVTSPSAGNWDAALVSFDPVGALTFITFPQPFSETTTLQVFINSDSSSKTYLQGIVASGFSLTGAASDTGHWMAIGYK